MTLSEILLKIDSQVGKGGGGKGTYIVVIAFREHFINKKKERKRESKL